MRRRRPEGADGWKGAFPAPPPEFLIHSSKDGDSIPLWIPRKTAACIDLDRLRARGLPETVRALLDSARPIEPLPEGPFVAIGGPGGYSWPVRRAPLGLIAVTFTVVALGIPPALAQAPETEETAAREQAVVLYTRAEERYREGDYQTAALLLREAIALHEAAAMHYNLAKALEELEDGEGAIAAYERFLELAPEHPERAAVSARVAEIRAMESAPPEAAALSEPEPEPEPVEATTSPSVGPWIVLASAALPLGSGIATGVLSAGAIDDARDSSDQPSAKEDADRARRLARAANASFAIAGALAIAGVVWAIVDRSGSDGRGTALRLGPTGLELRARW